MSNAVRYPQQFVTITQIKCSDHVHINTHLVGCSLTAAIERTIKSLDRVEHPKDVDQNHISERKKASISIWSAID